MYRIKYLLNYLSNSNNSRSSSSIARIKSSSSSFDINIFDINIILKIYHTPVYVRMCDLQLLFFFNTFKVFTSNQRFFV